MLNFFPGQQNTILKLEEKMEICSLEGTLTPERSHLHIVLGPWAGKMPLLGISWVSAQNYSQLLYVLGKEMVQPLLGISWVSAQIIAVYSTS